MVALTTLLLVLLTSVLERGASTSPRRPHATLLASEPAADAVLRESPTRVRLVFSEPVEPSLSRLELARPGRGTTRLTPVADPHDVHAVVAPVTGLAPGGYRLEWRIVSADGHPVSGSFAFSIGARPVVAPPPVAVDDSHLAVDSLTAAPAVGPELWGAPLVAALLRGAALAALMGLAGLLALGEWALPNGGAGAARAATVLGGAALLLIIAHAIAWAVNAGADHGLGSAFSTLGTSGTGHRELLRAALALLSLWALALARRRGIAASCAVAAVLVSGDLGHSAAIDPAWAVPAKALHLLAGSLWLGGLLWIVLGDAASPRYGDGVRRISRLALVAVILVAASGIVQMTLFLPSVRAVVQSTYGALALAKIAGLLILVLFGAYHRYVVLPRLATAPSPMGPRLRDSVRYEIGVMLLVILLGGLLAYVPPIPPS